MERLDALLPKTEENENVGKMSAKGDENECEPYRSRTCDTLIKSLLDGALNGTFTYDLGFSYLP